MAIVFWQQAKGGTIRVIDYHEEAGYGLDHYARMLDSKRYKYGKHYGPHDLAVREIGTGRSRVDVARSLGITFDVLPIARVEDGINAVRMMLPKVYIDKRKCAQLIESLRQYRVKFDEKRQVSLGPLHDHTSHAADCVRYMAMGLRSTEKAAPLKYSNTGII
jgi:hypothetical protein